MNDGHTRRVAAYVGVAAVGSLLVVLSAITDGYTGTALYAASSALIGSLAAAVTPFVRAIIVDSFKHPTRRSVVVRLDEDHVVVREPHQVAPRSH